MIYGYARVSTTDQNLDRQLESFKEFNVDKIFADKMSGKNFERTEYLKLIKKLKKDDLLIIKSIDRLGRNYDLILDQWRKITKEIGANIFVIDMPLLDTREQQGNLIGKFISDIVLQILSYVAENERESIRKRQAEGIEIAKAKGVHFGRPKIVLPANFKEIATQYKNKEIALNEALQILNMKKTTFYKFADIFVKN